MDINFDLEKRIADMVISINALSILLIAKDIITIDELNEAKKTFREDKEIKERLDRIECGKKVQELLEAEEITDEDIQWVKENGPKYDTEENVNKVVEILEFKKDPILGKLFNDKLWWLYLTEDKEDEQYNKWST